MESPKVQKVSHWLSKKLLLNTEFPNFFFVHFGVDDVDHVDGQHTLSKQTKYVEQKKRFHFS